MMKLFLLITLFINFNLLGPGCLWGQTQEQKMRGELNRTLIEIENTKQKIKLEEEVYNKSKDFDAQEEAKANKLLEKFKIAKQNFPAEPEKWTTYERQYIKRVEDLARLKNQTKRQLGVVNFDKEKLKILEERAAKLDNTLRQLGNVRNK